MSANMPLADHHARRQIETALDDTLVVEAAAGTGKTTELVKRILRVIAEGKADVTTIVAVTFTEKAAGELKLRLREELERARQLSAGSGQPAVVKRRFEDALKNLEDAHVSTIHGFCADLLRERPVESGIDPLFTVLTEGQARRCYEEAFNAWFQEVLRDAPEGVRRSLRRSSRPTASGYLDEDGPVERIRRAGWDLAEWRDFSAPWSRPSFDRDRAVDAIAPQVYACAALTAQPSKMSDALYLDTAPARRAGEDLRALIASGDYDTAEAVLVDLRRDRDFRRARKGYGSTFGKGVARADVHAAHQSLVDALDGFAMDADADLAALLREELRGSIDRYQDLKMRAGALDFLDLLLCARDLVRNVDEVRHDFQERFQRIFVDEFQDTDPLQAEILMLLAADDWRERDWTRVRPVPGKLFVVGDPKQSIYRFRRADVGIYQSVCEQLVAQGAIRIPLTTSFRSVPNIQCVVNAAFGKAMRQDPQTLQAGYVAMTPHRASGVQPSVVVLPVPHPYGKRNLSGVAIEHSLPDAVGAFVDWLIHESGWTVTERRGNDAVAVKVEARHVCILFRRFVSYTTDMTRPYLDALEARGIKHLLVGGRAFHNREEIETLRAALGAIEWPDDELSVFATLRGALFAIGDEELLDYHHRFGRSFNPFKAPDALPDHLAPIADALRLLARLHKGRNQAPVADTITTLLDETRAYVGFALRRAGEQVLANVLHVAELARQYDLSGGISFRGFVDDLREAAEQSQSAEAPIVEEGSDGVRVMTVHKAKGLEFPVVVLADITANLAPVEASRHLDAASGLCALRIGGWSPRELMLQQPLEQAREREEGIRVAYVAATRARDLLVVPAVGDEPYDRWIGALNSAIYPPPATARNQHAAPGCPLFRKDSVLWRPDDETARPSTVCPGLHHFDGETPEGAYDVVWWDPAALRLGAEPAFGLRRQELISKDVSPEVVAAGERRYRTWRQQREQAIAAGKVPSLNVKTATEWAAARIPNPESRVPGDVEIIAFDLVPGRPAGPRYGTLVHAALATVALDADAAIVEAVVRTQGRIVAATEAEVDSATAVVRSVLAHPLLADARRAQDAGRCLRETPVTSMIDGVLVEGVVDFAFEADDVVTVIDFKTDRAEGDVLARYSSQVGLYADAITRATGRRSRAVLMKV
jgi:ATP-dependent exoDNAse (exonuclease V) beta subunit